MPTRGDPIPTTRPETPGSAMEQAAAKFGVKFDTTTWDTIQGAQGKATVFTLLQRIPAYQSHDEAGEAYYRTLKFDGYFFVGLTDTSESTEGSPRLSDGFIAVVEKAAEIASLKGERKVWRIDLLEAVSQSSELAASLGKDAYFPEALREEVELLKRQQEITRRAGLIINNKLNREDRQTIAQEMEAGYEASRQDVNDRYRARREINNRTQANRKVKTTT